MSLTELRHLARNEDTEVTIRFFVADQKTMPVKASKEKLIASSDYFAAHDSPQHPRSTMIKAPRFLVPGVTIKQLSIDEAISHLHGYETHSVNVADAVELLLFARTFGIPTLKITARGHIEEQLERSFDSDGLADVVRELYAGIRDDTCCEIGNDVVKSVISIVARCCGRRWGTLRSDPAFKLLCNDFPALTMDILNAVADEDERRMHEKAVKAEEQGMILPQGSPQELVE